MEPTHEEDMSRRHYQPAGHTPVCRAGGRVLKRVEDGTEPDKYALLKVKRTTDVGKVDCPLCRRCLVLFIAKNWPEAAGVFAG